MYVCISRHVQMMNKQIIHNFVIVAHNVKTLSEGTQVGQYI